MRLKTPTVDIAPVKLYPYVKSKTQTHVFEFASCFCPYRLYPYDTLCTYGAKQFIFAEYGFGDAPNAALRIGSIEELPQAVAAAFSQN